MSTDELRSVFGGSGLGIICAFPLGFDDPIPLHPDFADRASQTELPSPKLLAL